MSVCQIPCHRGPSEAPTGQGPGGNQDGPALDAPTQPSSQPSPEGERLGVLSEQPGGHHHNFLFNFATVSINGWMLGRLTSPLGSQARGPQSVFPCSLHSAAAQSPESSMGTCHYLTHPLRPLAGAFFFFSMHLLFIAARPGAGSCPGWGGEVLTSAPLSVASKQGQAKV